MALFVDDRYRGQHGIARYASETVRRLGLRWRPLGGTGTPTTAADVINRRRLSLSRSDLLYSPGISAGPSRAQQLLTVHDLIHLQDPRGAKGVFHHTYYTSVLRPIIRRAGHVFTVSETSAVQLRAWLGPGVHVHDTGNGCSDEFTLEGSRLSRERPYVVYVGNLKPHKNPMVALQALARLPDLDLLMVTADSEVATSWASEFGVASRVSVVSGATDAELACIYRGAGALVFPSRFEGFGLPVVEALRCGTPVVYYRGCEAVADICAGTQYDFADADDPAEIAQAITAAVENGVGEMPCLDRYSWDSVAARVTSVLADLS